MKKLLKGILPMLVLVMTVPAMAEEHTGDAMKAEAVAVPAAMEAMAPAVEPKDIVDTAVANPDVSVLVAALGTAGLVDALKAEGPFTVFAPSNAAFAKLPAGTMEDLTKPENKEKLVALLKHHVVSGKVMAADAKGKTTELTTLAGDTITVDGMGETVKIGEAVVTGADMGTKNGVIHVVDTVIMPVAK